MIRTAGMPKPGAHAVSQTKKLPAPTGIPASAFPSDASGSPGSAPLGDRPRPGRAGQAHRPTSTRDHHPPLCRSSARLASPGRQAGQSASLWQIGKIRDSERGDPNKGAFGKRHKAVRVSLARAENFLNFGELAPAHRPTSSTGTPEHVHKTFPRGNF